MPNESSHNPSVDDWDSLPLDPASNDWDEPSPPVSAAQALTTAPDPAEDRSQPSRQPDETDFDPSPSVETDWDDESGPAPSSSPVSEEPPDLPPPADSMADPDRSLASPVLPSALADDEFDFEETLPEEKLTPIKAPDDSLVSRLNDDDDEDGFDQPGPPTPAQPVPVPARPDSTGQAQAGYDRKEAPAPKARPDDTFSKSETLSAESTRPPARTQTKGSNGDQARNDFLSSLMDGDSDAVPQKVELDLDGIFDMAKREAETLSPDATFQPVQAPQPDPAPPEDEIDVTPLNSSSSVKKVARFKMVILLSSVSLVVLGLIFAVYNIFFNKPAPPVPIKVIQADPLNVQPQPISGELNLSRFTVTFDDGEKPLVVEMELILHYRDLSDEPIIQTQLVKIRDLAYRLTKATGQSILIDNEIRRKFQDDLLTTLNNIDQIKADPNNPRLTYVQISLLRRR